MLSKLARSLIACTTAVGIVSLPVFSASMAKAQGPATGMTCRTERKILLGHNLDGSLIEPPLRIPEASLVCYPAGAIPQNTSGAGGNGLAVDAVRPYITGTLRYSRSFTGTPDGSVTAQTQPIWEYSAGTFRYYFSGEYTGYTDDNRQEGSSGGIVIYSGVGGLGSYTEYYNCEIYWDDSVTNSACFI